MASRLDRLYTWIHIVPAAMTGSQAAMRMTHPLHFLSLVPVSYRFLVCYFISTLPERLAFLFLKNVRPSVLQSGHACGHVGAR